MEHNDAIKRRIKHNQMQRNVRKSEIAVKRFFVLMHLFGIFLLITATLHLIDSQHWYVHKDAFNSPQNPYLKILGNDITPDYKILNSIRKVKIPNKPIYLIETKEMREKILKINTIKNVYIRRFWYPARFIVIIEERKPLLLIAPSETVLPIAFFTEGGRLIGREYLPLKKDYGATLILTYGTRGDDYRNWNEEKVKTLSKLAEKIKHYSGEKIEYIDLRNPNDIYVQMPSIKLRLGEIDSTIFKRIKSISSILPQIKSFNKKIKYVDLRWEKTNYLKLEYDKSPIKPPRPSSKPMKKPRPKPADITN